MRAEQADTTRDRILAGLVDLIVEEQPSSISIPAVAKRSGVSVRTVYQHFPTKEILFDAITPYLSRRIYGNRPPFTPGTDFSLVELDTFIRESVVTLTSNMKLFRALQLIDTDGSRAQQRAEDRLHALERATATLLGGLDRTTRARLLSLLLAITSWPVTERMHRDGVANTDEIGETISWAMRTLIEKAQRTKRVTIHKATS